MGAIIKTTAKSLAKVFRKPGYIIMAALVAFAIIFIANILPNYQFADFVLHSPSFHVQAKIKIIFGLTTFFLNNSTRLAQVSLILTAIFAGINIALVSYYFRRKIVADRLAGLGALGIVGTFFGVGCSACGSVVLSSIIGLGASAQVINFLPLKGLEFNLLSTAILIGSTVHISKKIQDPLSCRIS